MQVRRGRSGVRYLPWNPCIAWAFFMTVISFQVRSMKRYARKAAQKKATIETQTYRYRRTEAVGELWSTGTDLLVMNRMSQAASTKNVGTMTAEPILIRVFGNSMRFQEMVNMTFRGCLNMKWVLPEILAIAGTF